MTPEQEQIKHTHFGAWNDIRMRERQEQADELLRRAADQIDCMDGSDEKTPSRLVREIEDFLGGRVK